MQRFEYKVVPAPRRGEKRPGVKRTDDKFALALTDVLNTFGHDGWEYLRADTLPCEERSGLTGKVTNFQHMLVFRRAIQAQATQAEPAHVAAPIPVATPVTTPLSDPLSDAVARLQQTPSPVTNAAPEGKAPRVSASASGGKAPAVATPRPANDDLVAE